MDEIIAVTPTNVADPEKMHYLLKSAEANNFSIKMVGLGQPFGWVERMIWFRDYLQDFPYEENPIICFTDAYDVFYTDDLETIKNKFLAFNCEIVWSVEKFYSHQLEEDRAFYERLCPTSYGYKYINAGTCIGYRTTLLKLFNDILEVSLQDDAFISRFKNLPAHPHTHPYRGKVISGSDQSWISHQICQYWNKYNIKMDYLCDIFYVPCGDWDNLEKYVGSNLRIIATGKRPSVIHVPWIQKYDHVFIKLFNAAYNVLQGKTYTWEFNTITFLDDGKLEAFGQGTYKQLSSHIFQADFALRAHILIFTEDYSKFTSVRKDDNEIVRGQFISGGSCA